MSRKFAYLESIVRGHAMIRPMPCTLDVDTEVKKDILDCDADVRREIGDFLLELEQSPLPRGRHKLERAKSDTTFYIQLPCGFYISWEIIGNQMHLALTGKTDGLRVRIL